MEIPYLILLILSIQFISFIILNYIMFRSENSSAWVEFINKGALMIVLVFIVSPVMCVFFLLLWAYTWVVVKTRGLKK